MEIYLCCLMWNNKFDYVCFSNFFLIWCKYINDNKEKYCKLLIEKGIRCRCNYVEMILM